MDEKKDTILIGTRELTEVAKALDRPVFVPGHPLLGEGYIAMAKDLYIYALQKSSISNLYEAVKDKHPQVLSELRGVSEVVYDAVLLMHERHGDVVSVRIDEDAHYDLPNSEVVSAKLDELFFLYDTTSLMASPENTTVNSDSLERLAVTSRIYVRMIQVSAEIFQLIGKNTYQIEPL